MKGKTKAVSNRGEAKLGVKKGAKAVKDPNKPKRPPSAFFVFMEDFRKEFKEANPNNKSVAAVGKAAGERWKSMSEADKAPYAEKAEKRKKQYDKDMDSYNKKLAGEEQEESDKSRSEVHDENEDDESGEDEDDED